MPAAGQVGPGLGAGACRIPRLRSRHAPSCPLPAARRRARPRGPFPCGRACRALLAALSPRCAPSRPPPPRPPPPTSAPFSPLPSRTCAASSRAPASSRARAAPPHATSATPSPPPGSKRGTRGTRLGAWAQPTERHTVGWWPRREVRRIGRFTNQRCRVGFESDHAPHGRSTRLRTRSAARAHPNPRLKTAA